MLMRCLYLHSNLRHLVSQCQLFADVHTDSRDATTHIDARSLIMVHVSLVSLTPCTCSLQLFPMQLNRRAACAGALSTPSRVA